MNSGSDFIAVVCGLVLFILVVTGGWAITEWESFNAGEVFIKECQNKEDVNIRKDRKILIYKNEEGVITLYKEFALPKGEYIFVGNTEK